MPAEQLWLGVEAPPQAAPRRERARGRMEADAVAPDRQIELVLASPEPDVALPAGEIPTAVPAIPPAPPPPEIAIGAEERQPFSLWLLSQSNRRGSLSELAKAAKLDRLFPRAGTADDVRARFSLAGAEARTRIALIRGFLPGEYGG